MEQVTLSQMSFRYEIHIVYQSTSSIQAFEFSLSKWEDTLPVREKRESGGSANLG